jgi:uncharacterized 2Fe-2S/4Fe-4S cluster protein (DUF4445 family)
VSRAKTHHSVTFEPSGHRAAAAAGDDLLTVARRAGVDIETSCGGKGTCGKCRVRVQVAGGSAAPAGEGESPASPLTETERRLLDLEALDAGLRLACQTRVHGDALVFVPEESRRASQVAHKETRQRTRRLEPAVRTYTVTLPVGRSARGAAAHGSASGLLSTALATQHHLHGLTIEPAAAEKLSRLVSESPVDLTAVVWRPGADGATGAVLDVWPSARAGRVLGLAVDVGTTTIAAYLADLATGEVIATESALNPQVAYGDDIIARLQYAAHHAGGGRELQELVTAEVDRLAERVTERSGTGAHDIYDMVMVGNTAIHHLFLGLDTASLRRAPFEPAVTAAVNTTASAVGLHLHPSCRLYALPNEAGFVGADNVAVIIAEEPYKQDEATLLIDVGTNGELVLGDRKRMFSASCATGPAFEGAHIEHGMRAAPGAIERVRIDPLTLDVSFKVIGTEAWSGELPSGQVRARGICGSGIIEAAAEMLRCGVILPDGGFNPELTHERILLVDGRPRKLVLARAEESVTGRPLTVSLKDIRALQLGKAALRAGAEVLLSHYGADRPDRVVLAGAFGSYIDTKAALAIGMLPACDPDKVTSVGNAAGDGALLALLALGKRREAEWAAEAVKYVELASEPDFQRRYMQAMRFEASG